jgi:tetratricopeptide (TPR) repeat protein
MSANSPSPKPLPPPNSSLFAITVACFAIVGGLISWWFLMPEPGPAPKAPSSKHSPKEISDLLELRNKAIGHLENEQWTVALKVLDQIKTMLPDDVFVSRNRAVAMAGQKSFGHNQPQSIPPEHAEAAAQELLKAAPDDYVSYLLAARIAAACQQPELATERFRKACELAPKNPTPWFEYYKDSVISTSKGTRGQSVEAIKNCVGAAPNNVTAVIELFGILAAEKDPGLLELMKSKSQLFVQLSKFAQRPSLDPKKYFDEAVRLLPDATQSKDAKAWDAVAAQLRSMSNVSKGTDISLADFSRLQPNPLEFVQFRFSTEEINADSEPAKLSPAIDVAFVAAPQQITVASAPLCVQIADFDLDQQPDLFVLTAGKLQVFGRGTPADPKASVSKIGPWQVLAEIPVDPKLTKFVVTDLDLDVADVTSKGPLRPTPAPAANKSDVVTERKANKFIPGDATTICQQADPDLILYGPGGIQIWRNEAGSGDSKRTFIRCEKTGMEEVREVELVCAADFDLEGDLDLILTHSQGLSLWSNREKFTFKNVSEDSVLPEGVHVRQIIPVDWDRDVDLDFVMIGEPSKASDKPRSICGVLRNQLHGKLNWESSLDGGDASTIAEITQAALLDADANASWDLALASKSAPRLITTATPSAGHVKIVKESPLANLLPGGLSSLDYDNDGTLDLLSWQDRALQIVRGSPSGQFSETALKLPESAAAIRDCQIVDLDHDGDLDLVLMNEQGVQLLSNEGGNKNHWIKVRLRAKPKKDGAGTPGQIDKRVNHQGIGSLVELKTQAYYQPQVASGESIHFGLGERTKADLLRVIWTNGVPQGLLDLEGDVEICEEQAPKGSCPFVYTWNGEHFEFYTDLLWNAPLGLQYAEGVLAQPRAWEYLKIAGDRMHLKDGKYVLQVTEELWEATYFDQIELLAIDHPADVEIYSNEKVGPAELAPYKIHTVEHPHFPVAAQDQKGRDVLQQIIKEDGDFTKTYDERLRQGLTEEHWLELDLGKIDHPGAITLFLTGWMYPTETSISVAVSQNPENKQARPPALWVPDANGEWKEIRPFMGFPGGKTKTIAIDLTAVFAGQDHRLRIVTNMEFYWDHAFYTVGEQPVKVISTTLNMTSADLHYRGTSQHYWKPGNGPDQYDYRYVTTSAIWPPMQGNFTRFGDVLEILSHQDDRLVVIGAGDEITLTFNAPDTPLQPGWKRDFIMHNVGWDKDADLHTLYGQTVEPLPFNAMSGYPFDAHEGPGDTKEYRHYLKHYQTRTQSHSQFWNWVKESKRPE